MSRRSDVAPALDKKIFNQTARRTKKINVAPRIQRGGILL